MKDKIRFKEFKESGIFCQIDDLLWETLCEEIEMIELIKGRMLFCEGDSADGIYLIVQGEINLRKTGPGGQKICVGTQSPFGTIGEMQVLRGGLITEDFCASTDCVLQRMPKSAIDDLALNHPGEIHKIQKVISKQFRRDQLRDLLPRLFGLYHEDNFAEIERNIEWIQLSAGEVLCRQGDPGDCLYLIASGRICAVKNYGGPDEKKLNSLGRGEILGEIAFLTKGVRSATLFALRKSELVKISRTVFETFANASPHSFFTIGQTLARRILRIEGAHPNGIPQPNLAIFYICKDHRLKAFIQDFIKSFQAQVPLLHLNSRNLDNRFGFPGIAGLPDDDPLNVRLAGWLDEQEFRSGGLIYEADATVTNWTRRCLRNADKILVIIPGEKQPVRANQEFVSLLRRERPGCSASDLIFLHEKTVQKPNGTQYWLNTIPAENHHHLLYHSKADLLRVIRCLRGKAINLVLSGGAACGLAHMGVIRAFEESEMPIDSISGTSIGAIIAAQYAMGMGYEELLECNRWLWLTSKPMRDTTIPLISFLKGRRFESMAKAVYGDVQIEDLWLPFFCVSTSLTNADQVIHRKGNLFNALRASSSVPGLVPPVVIEGEILVDGGIMNNLPVNIARQFYQGPIIAVDVTEARGLRISQVDFPSPWNMLLRRMLPPKNRERVPGIFEILYHSAIVGSQHRTERAAKDADFYLRPPLDRFRFLEFDAFDEIVESGYRFSIEKIRNWKERVTG